MISSTHSVTIREVGWVLRRKTNGVVDQGPG